MTIFIPLRLKYIRSNNTNVRIPNTAVVEAVNNSVTKRKIAISLFLRYIENIKKGSTVYANIEGSPAKDFIRIILFPAIDTVWNNP